MEAGRELDALVAERVMGLAKIMVKGDFEEFPMFVLPERKRAIWNAFHAPRYSTDIAAAWAVVERMRELGWKFQLDWDGPEPAATFWKDEASLFDWTRGPAPSAISNAALAALDAKEEG